MSSDFIAWIVAIALGAAVVGLGWQRKLANTTRNWLPRFGEASEQVTVAPGLSDREQRRRPLSPRQRRWIVWGYLLLSLCNAALASWRPMPGCFMRSSPPCLRLTLWRS